MDPNENVRELRALVRAVLSGAEVPVAPAAERMAELFDSLDGWLLDGGFLPDGWGQK